MRLMAFGLKVDRPKWTTLISGPLQAVDLSRPKWPILTDALRGEASRHRGQARKCSHGYGEGP